MGEPLSCATLTVHFHLQGPLATKRSTFQKRQRENDLKDKARAKEARRAAKRAQDRMPTPPEEVVSSPEEARPAAASPTGATPPTGTTPPTETTPPTAHPVKAAPPVGARPPNSDS